MFSDYLARQLSHRGKVNEKLRMSKTTYYRRLKNPDEITIGELKQLVVIGELDEQKIINFIYRREK